MKFLENVNKEDIMLININYHKGTKTTKYNDYLDVIYKNTVSGKKHLVSIENPEMEIYFTKPEFRDYGYNKTFLEMQKAYMKTIKFKGLPFEIAKEAGQNYINYINNCRETGNWRAINNIHKYRYVFGSDYDIENWYRIQWILNYHNERQKHITKQFLDIEADTINIPGFPKPGECPINAVSVVDKESKQVFTFLLRNEKNPQIKEFEENIDAFVDSLHDAFDETYGELKYNIYMYDEDDELKMITDIFKLINTLKRDFLLIWNMGFDIPYIVERIKILGGDPKEIMCHKDFKIKELYYKKDNRNFKIENKSDYFKISSYTIYMDQMINYGALRKGKGEQRSFNLNFVAQKELRDTKLDYSEEANIKTLPYVNYWLFVMYNIKDTLLQMGIEDKTHDLDDMYLRAYNNATSYHKVFKQTVFLKNRAYLEYFKQGLIIGNNVNIDYEQEYVPKSKKENDDDEEEKFDGALVADPQLNTRTGIKILGAQSMYIFDNVVDMDFSSMYPHIIIAFNIAPNCMIGKLMLYKTIKDYYNMKDIDNDKYDAGKDFVDNFLTGRPDSIGTKWFNLPDASGLNSLIKGEFNIKQKEQFMMKATEFNNYYLEQLVVNI